MNKLLLDTYFGLEYLHKKEIAHMNLKPNNILMDFEGNYKIADI